MYWSGSVIRNVKPLSTLVLSRDVILPLALFEGHQIDPFGLHEALDRVDESLTQGATITVDGTRASSWCLTK